jgi:hypothetical protein
MPQPWQELSFKHKHPRDDSIVFDEPTHVYTVNGSSKGVISCTKFLHEFFPHFDSDAVIDGMIKRGLKGEYVGMTKQQIKDKWAASGEESSSKGTALHLAIEQFLHGHPELIEPSILTTPEWQYFKNFWAQHGHDLVPYRSEWEVWAEEYKLAGSIDMIFYRPSDDSYVIYDWKRSKEIKKEAFGNSKGFGPVAHLPDCNYWHYTLQLNVYRWFLETHYGLKISDMYLVIMHPNNTDYKRFKLNRLDEEVEGMMAARKAALEYGAGEIVRFASVTPAYHGHKEKSAGAPAPTSSSEGAYDFVD